MGRPLNKKYFGNRNIGGVGGQGVGSVTLASNNSIGYTNGSAVTFTAPDIPNGVTATGTITTFAIAGALTDKTTYTRSGTSVAATGTYTNVVQKAGGTTAGTGAKFTIVKSTSATTYASVAITLTNAGSGYATGTTLIIDGASLGGVTTTNDLTLTITTFVGTTGTISGFVITNAGSGYSVAPTISAIASPGTVGTTTYTPVLATNSGAVGSATNKEPAIIAYAWVSGSRVKVDIVKQEASRRYAIRTASLVANEPWSVRSAILVSHDSATTNEMDINATDVNGNTYYVTKLTAHKALLTRRTQNGSNAWIYATGQTAPWKLVAATGIYVQVDNA